MKKKLNEIAVIGAGQGAPQGDNNYSDTGIPFVKAGNLKDLINGDSISSIQYVSNEVAKLYKLKLFPKGTILFAKSGMSCLKGYVYVLTVDAYVVNHLACIVPNENISDYLKYYFIYNKPNQLIKDRAYPSIRLSDIGNLKVELSESETRNIIVCTLDKISLIIDAKKQKLLEYEQLIKSRFEELFGDPVINPYSWKTKSFSECGDLKNGMNFKSNESGVEIKYLGVGDFKNRTTIDDMNELSNINLNKMPSSKNILMDGDIIFVRSNGNKKLVGRCLAIYPGETKTTYSGFCIRFRKAEDSLEIPYLLQVLKAKSMRQMMTGRGANIQNLNQKILSNLDIPIPTLRIQKEFTVFIEQINKLKFNIQKSFDETQLLFDSLMQEYFG